MKKLIIVLLISIANINGASSSSQKSLGIFQIGGKNTEIFEGQNLQEYVDTDYLYLGQNLGNNFYVLHAATNKAKNKNIILKDWESLSFQEKSFIRKIKTKGTTSHKQLQGMIRSGGSGGKPVKIELWGSEDTRVSNGSYGIKSSTSNFIEPKKK